jgi:hypothetical protein
MHYIWVHQHQYRFFYFVASFGTGMIFYPINILLFIRVLAADGYLGEYGRAHTAINRDAKNVTATNGKAMNGKSK